MPTITVLTATTILITGASWWEIHREVDHAEAPTYSIPVTLWSEDPYTTGCQRETGGNTPGPPITLHLSRCGRIVVLGHSALGVEWVELGYRMDRDSDVRTTSGDFFLFLTDFFAGSPEADFTGEGQVTAQDFFDFLACFLGV